MTTIKELSQETSVLGTEGEKNKSEYIKEKMESYDYNVEFQEFEAFDLGENESKLFKSSNLEEFLTSSYINKSDNSLGTIRNVIATSKEHNNNNKTLYIFAHYDTDLKTTGVYDNISGVSTVLEIARVLQKQSNQDFNITYIFFSGEERFRKGSRYFVSQLSESDRENILGAINVDVVGYTGFKFKSDLEGELPEVGKPEILLAPWVKKDSLELMFNDKFNNKYNVNIGGGAVSDDISFARLNIPTILIADSNYMTGTKIKSDSIKTQLDAINLNVIEGLVKDISEFIKEFDISKFEEINLISDEEKGIYINE